VVFPVAGVVVAGVEVVAGGVWVPPVPESPVDAVVLAGVVVAGVVVCAVLVEVVVAGVVFAGEVACVVFVVVDVAPVEAVELVAGVVGPRWSSGLVVVGVRAGVELGRLSAILAPPQAASTTPLSVAATSTSGRARRVLTTRAEASAVRTSGSR